MDLYRADRRTLADMKSKYSGGFAAWCPLTVAQARTLIGLMMGNTDTTGLPSHLVSHFGTKSKLNDLSAYIKWTKNKTDTVWISTAINTECGGQSSGATVFKFTIDFKEFDIVGNKLSPLPKGRGSDLQPSLLLDGDTLGGSNLIALNHGPRHDAEVAFLTTIPLSKVVGTV